MREVSQPNSGYGAFPALLKRSRLPRDHTIIKRDVAHVGGSSAAVAEEDARLQYVSEKDLRVGGTLNVYGRELLLCGADQFTKDWYGEHYGLPAEAFLSINMSDPVDPPLRMAVPPPTGFGSDEDSLGSFLYLVPKQPKTDQKKLHEMDGVLLRFSAKLGQPAGCPNSALSQTVVSEHPYISSRINTAMFGHLLRLTHTAAALVVSRGVRATASQLRGVPSPCPGTSMGKLGCRRDQYHGIPLSVHSGARVELGPLVFAVDLTGFRRSATLRLVRARAHAMLGRLALRAARAWIGACIRLGLSG